MDAAVCTECTEPPSWTLREMFALRLEQSAAIEMSTEAPESGGCARSNDCDVLGEEERPSRRPVSGLSCDFSRATLCPFQGAAAQETAMQLRLGDSISDTLEHS